MEQPAIQDDTDADLVLKAKAGDGGAFETLVERHERRVYSLAFRILSHEHDARDVTQQTFLSALEGLQGFRGEARFGNWLLRIATHAALKIIRKRKGLDTVSLEAATQENPETESIPHPEYMADWRASPDELAQRSEVRRLLQEALEHLPESGRMVFLLRDVEGLSIKETAEALHLTEANTKVRLLRARLQLREILTRALGDPGTAIRPSHTH